MRRTVIAGLIAAALLASGREARATDSSLGLELGYVKANRVDPTLFFAGDFRFHVSRTLALAPEFSYWKKSATVLGITASRGDLQVGVNAVAVIRAGRGLEFFAGAGGGMHHLTGDLAVRGGAALSESLTKPGLDVLAGLDVRAGGGLSFFLAARRDWVLSLGGEDPARLDQWKFSGGFRLRF